MHGENVLILQAIDHMCSKESISDSRDAPLLWGAGGLCA